MSNQIDKALNEFNASGYDDDQEVVITVIVNVYFNVKVKKAGKFRILKNKENNRYRVLFRDNQGAVLLNHYVNPDIKFKKTEMEQNGVKKSRIEYETYDFAQLTESNEPQKYQLTIDCPPTHPEFNETLYTTLLDAQKKNAALLGLSI